MMERIPKCFLLFPIYLLLASIALKSASAESDLSPGNCTRCEYRPADWCDWAHKSPIDGGPPCRCRYSAEREGCMLEPCSLLSPYDVNTVCDASKGADSRKKRAFSYLCRGSGGECETCASEFPPTCTQASYEHPPLKNGPACTCVNDMSPPGCTLQPCSWEKNIFKNCICHLPNDIGRPCFHPKCPGSSGVSMTPSNQTTGRITPSPSLTVAVDPDGNNNDCTKCGSIPPDCTWRSIPPAKGGPPCSCTYGSTMYEYMHGCTLKPCDQVESLRQECECAGMAGREVEMCYNSRCVGDSNTCESCQRQAPPDCILMNNGNGPIWGFPACSCSRVTNPSGCTLKPCTEIKRHTSSTFCICQPGVDTSDPCYYPRCPGSNSTTTPALLSFPVLESPILSSPIQITTGPSTQNQTACTTCTNSPLQDCDPSQLSPWNGGPACLCTNEAPHQGCVLKPCSAVNNTYTLCDSTNGAGEDKSFPFVYRCSGNPGECESCKPEYPPICDLNTAYNNPPAKGGPPCSCGRSCAAPGCTLRPCEGAYSMAVVPCICTPKYNTSSYCFQPTCPSSVLRNGGGHPTPSVPERTTITDSASRIPAGNSEATKGTKGNNPTGLTGIASGTFANLKILLILMLIPVIRNGIGVIPL